MAEIQLFPDQAVMVEKTRAAMRQSRNVLIQLPTGGGKTVLSSYMLSSMLAKGKRGWFIVPRRELMRQTSETFEKFGLPHSFISAGMSYDPFKRLHIATTGTLARRLHKMTAPDVAFVDETRHGGAELDRIIAWLKANGCWIVGLDATPVRTDGKGLGCYYDRMVEGPQVGELMEAGRLSRYRLFAPQTPDLTGIRTVAGDYAKGQLADKMESDRVLVGNSVKHYKQHADGLLNVAFAVSVKHAEILAQAFRDGGVSAACIHGGMDDAERSRIIKAFARRELMTLTSCSLLCFGFDLASAAQMDVTVEAMTDCAPTKSLSLQMQKNGRVLRMKPRPAVILDHAGNCQRHGMPDDPREWSLEGELKESKGGEPTLAAKQCPIGDGGCGYVQRAGYPCCSNCGFVFPIMSRSVEEVDGDLIEVTREQMKAIAKSERQVQGRSETLADLIELAKRTGKNPRWAQHVWQARQKKAGVR